MRCDGISDCVDSSDESYCHGIILIDNYDKTIISKDDREKVPCYLSLTILDVISIDGNNGYINPTFKITIEWKDQRLKFQHLKKGVERLLPKTEVDKIWKPTIILYDTRQFQR